MTVLAQIPIPNIANHGVAKAALAHLVRYEPKKMVTVTYGFPCISFRHLAREEANRGVRINSVSPGLILSPETAALILGDSSPQT